jgi:hypothetical protein
VHGGGRPRLKRRRRILSALAAVALVGAAVVVTQNGLPELVSRDGRRTTAATAPTTAAPSPTTAPATPPPPLLCEFLGDLGAGGALTSSPADREVATAETAVGDWLPDPAALPRALGDHHFQGGCTRTWAEPTGEVVAALFQFPSRADAQAMRGQLRDRLRARGVAPATIPLVTGGELYRLDAGGGSGQLVMFPCNDRVLQIHTGASGATRSPLLVRLAQGANQRLHERTGCPL